MTLVINVGLCRKTIPNNRLEALDRYIDPYLEDSTIIEEKQQNTC